MAKPLGAETIKLLRTLCRSECLKPREIQAYSQLPVSFVRNALYRLPRQGYLTRLTGGWYALTEKGARAAKTPQEAFSDPNLNTHSQAPVKTQPEPASQLSAPSLNLNDALDTFVAQIAHVLVARLDEAIEDRIKPELDALLQLKADEAVATLRPSQAKRPKVAVIGLLPVQAQEIKHAFDDLLDLSFHHAHTDASKTARRVQGVEAVFVLTKFMNHMVTGALKASGVGYIPCNGAVSSLKGEIERWLDQQTRGEAQAA